MFIGSIIIHYYIMSFVMVDTINDVKNSIGKLYMSIIMAILMVILEIFMHDFYYKHISMIYYLISLILIVLFVYLFRKQVLIDDKNYLREMIQHHSMAILTSTERVKKSRDNRVVNLAKNIIDTQVKEIDLMNRLVGKIE